MQRFALLIALAACLTGCGGDFAGDGKAAFGQRKYAEAADLLQVALNAAEDPEVRFYLGVSLFQTARPMQAQRTLAPLLDHPEYAQRAIRQTVDILLDQDSLESARELVTQARRGGTQDPNLLEALVLVDSERLSKAKDAIKELLASHLGDGMERRAMPHVDRIIFAEEAAFLDTFQTVFQQLSEWYGFTDETNLRDLLGTARRALKDVQGTLEQVAAVDPESFTSRLEIARLANARGDLDEVKKACVEIIRIDADKIVEPERRSRLRGFRLQAVEFIRNVSEVTQRYDEGIALLESAVEAVGQDSMYYHLARLYYLADKQEKLRELSAQWIEEEPRNYWASFYHGWSLHSQGLYDDAIRYLTRALSAQPNNSAFNLVVGRCYERKREFGQALVYYARAGELSPRDVNIVFDQARIHEAIGDPQGARSILLRALEDRFRSRRSAEHLAIKQRLTDMYQKVGLGIESLDEARTLLDSDPNNPYIALRVAQLESAAGDWREAWKLVRKVESRFPELNDAWRVGAQIAMENAKWGFVHTQAEVLAQLEPNDSTIPWIRARAFLSQRRYAEARDQAQAALEKNPDALDVRLIQIDIELAERSWTKAATLAQSALKTHIDSEPLRLRLAEAYVGSKDWTKVASVLEPRMSDPDLTVATMATLSLALTKIDRKPEAIELLQRAHDLVPADDHRTRLRVCSLLYDAGDNGGVATYLQSLLDDLPDEASQLRPASVLLARTRHRNKNFLGVCDVLVQMRRANEKTAAYNLFMELASKVGAYGEVTSVFDLARAEARATARGLHAALRSQLTVGDWAGAQESLRLLEVAEEDRSPERLLAEARVALGTGRYDAGSKLLTALAGSKDPSERAAAYHVWLGFYLHKKQPAKAMGVLDQALVAAPDDARVRRLGGKAALLVSDVERGVTLLEESLKLNPKDLETRALLSAAYVARDRYPMALQVLEGVASPKINRIRTYVQALMDEEEPEGRPTMATYLSALRKGRFDDARAMLPRAHQVSRSWRPVLKRLATRLQKTPSAASRLGTVFARASVFALAEVLGAEAMQELHDLRQSDRTNELEISLFGADVLLRFNNSKAAAGVVAPFVAEGVDDPLVIYLAGHAAMLNAGAKNLQVIVDSQFSRRAMDPELARDFRDLALESKDLVLAFNMQKHIGQLSNRDNAIRAHMLIALNKRDTAAKVAAQLPVTFRARDPYLSFLAAYSDLVEGKPGAEDGMNLLLDEAATMDKIEPTFLLKALVRTGRLEQANDVATALMRVSPYDAYNYHELAEAVKDQPEAVHLHRRLAAAASFVDPRAKLRNTPRDLRATLDW